MNKDLYNAAMDKIVMSDECLGEILDNINEVQPEPITKKHKKVRYIQLVTALVVFVFGSVGVAAETIGFEWIKNLFSEEVTVTSVYDMVTEIENFKCESDFGVRLSPIGMLCNEQDFFAVFQVDQFPDNLSPEYIQYDITPDSSDKYDGYGYSYSDNYDSEKNYVTLKCSTPEKFFKDGDHITLRLHYDEYSYEPSKPIEKRKPLHLDNLATLSFTLQLGKYDFLNINYKEHMPDFIPKCDYPFLFDEINITPFSATTLGRLNFYADEMLTSGLRIVLRDGTELLMVNWSSSSYGANSVIMYDTTWMFDEPIDPNSISEIYLGKMLIYRK